MASWALAFNEKARTALLKLDASLQEEILDELDHLAQNPGQLHRAGSSPVFIADFTRDHGSHRHYLFLSLQTNVATRTLEVIDIGHHARQIG